MRPENSEEAFRNFIAERGKNLHALMVDEAISLMADFYLQQRCDGCVALDEDGDMLLYEFGIYDWGNGDKLEINLTRQLITEEQYREGEEVYEEQIISQLSLALYYDLTQDIRYIKAINKWCQTPEDIDDFLQFIHSSEAIAIVKGRHAREVSLNWERV